MAVAARHALVVFLLLAPACAASDAPPSPAPEDGADSGPGPGPGPDVADGAIQSGDLDAATAPGPDASTLCASGGQLAAGDHDYSISAGGRTRTYRVHVPPGLAATTRAPLLLNLHPLTLNGAGQAAFSGMNPVADERGVIVAYPDGISGSWNGGACCGTAAQQMLDDVAFMRAMIGDISAHACIDARRVWATGMSNGGFLSQRLGCEAADVIAAIAPAAGVIGIPAASCQPARPIPVLEFHGSADSLVDYAQVAPTIATWVARDHCTGAAHEIFRHGAVHCEAHDGCAGGATVVLCTADGGGHCWPGGAFCPVGTAITDIDGNRYMMDFFFAHPMP
jgi:polyhydroxybutyrate depolymerase